MSRDSHPFLHTINHCTYHWLYLCTRLPSFFQQLYGRIVCIIVFYQYFVYTTQQKLISWHVKKKIFIQKAVKNVLFPVNLSAPLECFILASRRVWKTSRQKKQGRQLLRKRPLTPQNQYAGSGCHVMSLEMLRWRSVQLVAKYLFQSGEKTERV